MSKEFVHLHAHSEYSILDGAVKIPDLVHHTKEKGMKALALTDHGNLFGVIEFYKTALKHRIKPIIGMEAYIAENSLEEKNPNENLSHLTLIAENEKGYKNLLYLSTISYLKGFYYKPRIDKQLLRENSEGLIALSGCLKGEIPQKILREDEEGARRALLEYLDIFGKENFYLELQEIGLEENIIVNKKLLEFAAHYEVNIVATNDVHFLTPQDHLLQDVLICIQTGKKLDDENRLKIRTNKIYLRSPAEMWEIFGEIEEALTNTLVIAERANVKLELDPTRVHLPKFEIPEGYRDADDFLRQLAVEGLNRKFGGNIPEEYKRRLDYELEVMKEMGFSGYFLIIWDLVREARRRGIPVGPGRGSAVGSLVLYALDVTEIDPIRYNLIFERFLNPERISPPDVDMDFSDIRREELIEYLRNKYGEESVAQIITFGRVMAKGVIRDVARVLGFPYKEADRIAKLIPNGADLDEALEQVSELKSLSGKGEKYKMLFDISRRIEGQIRNISTHAAGLVIAPGKIYEHAPLYKSTDGTISTQFDMKSLEELGLLKIDLLGLRTLTIIDWTVKEVRKRHNPDFKIEEIPLDDLATYELLSRGETQGIFQLESEGFQNILRRIKPTKFEDLIAIVALYRPGPIKSGMLESFIRRKRGEEEVEYLHERLEEVLSETYGVIAYQEQVMQIASTLAGFSMGEADLLRRAMGKKKVEIMEKQRVQFVEGCMKNGISREEAEKIFKAIEPFAGYGFNKSHAAGYALLAYRTAYLKAHYPLEFLTANLSAEMNTQDFQKKIYKFVAEARRLGFGVLPPDINKSEYKFSIHGENSILFGLGAVKNVGESAVRAIMDARKQKGSFTSFEDFVESVDTRKVNKKTIEYLIKAGAFDNLYSNRKDLLAKMDILLSRKNGRKKASLSLFGETTFSQKEEEVKGLPYTLEDKLAYEKEAFGFFLSGHPMEKFECLKFYPVHAGLLLERFPDGSEVKLVGVVMGIKRKKSKKGQLFAQVTMRDLEDEFEVMVFPSLYADSVEYLREGEIVKVEGRLQLEEDKAKVIASHIEKFSGPTEIELDLTALSEDKLDKLVALLEKYRGDKVSLVVRIEGSLYKSQKYSLSDDPRIFKELELLLGSDSIRVLI